jgi:small subunit ribosomal protein S16
MAIALRLSRGGSKKRPYYKVIAADSRSPRDGKYLEQIGTYNPLLAKDDDNRVRLVEDRVRYWLGVGAQPTDRVARMLDKAGIKERAATSNPNKAEPGKKAKDRADDRASKLAEAEEARAAAEQAARDAAAAPAPAEKANEVTPDSDAGDTVGAVEGESTQAPAEG